MIFLAMLIAEKAVCQNPLINWKAGETVTVNDIANFGLSNCFVAQPITNDILKRIEGKSYKKGCPVSLSDLRYLKLLHFDAEGNIKTGEMICHKNISSDLIEIFTTLFKAEYPIEKMILIDEYDADDDKSMADNNSSCFNFRTVAGSKKVSRHALGMAVDINPRYNPEVKGQGKNLRIRPSNGKKYSDRQLKFNYKIDRNDLCYREFIKHGFTWGGNWRSSKDYQHFEKK